MGLACFGHFSRCFALLLGSAYFILFDIFSDDEPDDGANHYIIVYGFHQPHLFGLLAELGLSVSSIIRINSQDYARFVPPQTDEQPADKDEKTLGNYTSYMLSVDGKNLINLDS